MTLWCINYIKGTVNFYRLHENASSNAFINVCLLMLPPPPPPHPLNTQHTFYDLFQHLLEVSVLLNIVRY